MFGFVPFSELEMDWSDPIPWDNLGIFTNDRSNMLHNITAVFLVSMVGFLVLFKACERLLENHGHLVFGPHSEFHKMSKKVKKEYYSRIVSDVHAIASITLSVISTYYSCERPNESIFTSYDCAVKPNVAGLYCIALSSAYCIYDVYVCLVEIEFTMFECRDYIFHHVVGCIGAVLAYTGGHFLPCAACAILISESSNFCMNIRWRLLKHKMTEHWYFIAASMAFMIVFFFSRVFFMLMVVLRCFEINQSFPFRKQHPLVYSCIITDELCLVLLYML